MLPTKFFIWNKMMTEPECDLPLNIFKIYFRSVFIIMWYIHTIYCIPLWVYYPRFQRGGHRRKTGSEEPNTLRVVIGPCQSDSEHDLSTMAVSCFCSDRSLSQEIFCFTCAGGSLDFILSISTWIRWLWWRGGALQCRRGAAGGWWRIETSHSWLQFPVFKVRFSVTSVNTYADIIYSECDFFVILTTVSFFSPSQGTSRRPLHSMSPHCPRDTSRLGL